MSPCDTTTHENWDTTDSIDARGRWLPNPLRVRPFNPRYSHRNHPCAVGAPRRMKMTAWDAVAPVPRWRGTAPVNGGRGAIDQCGILCRRFSGESFMRRWRITPHENDGMGCRRPHPPLAGDSPRQRGQGGDRPVRHPMPTIFEGVSCAFDKPRQGTYNEGGEEL